MLRVKKLTLALPMSLAVLPCALAQSESPRDFTTYQPNVSPTRIDNDAAPKIDGDRG